MYPLVTKIDVRVANGAQMAVTRLVRVYAMLASLKVRLFLRVIPAAIKVILGYPLLSKFDPNVDWKKRIVYITRRNQAYVIKGTPATAAFRIMARRQLQLPTPLEVTTPPATSGRLESHLGTPVPHLHLGSSDTSSGASRVGTPTLHLHERTMQCHLGPRPHLGRTFYKEQLS